MPCNFANCLLQHLHGCGVYGGLDHLKTQAGLCYSAYSLAAIDVDIICIFAEGHGGAYLRTMCSVWIIATIFYRCASDLAVFFVLCPSNLECSRSVLWQRYSHLLRWSASDKSIKRSFCGGSCSSASSVACSKCSLTLLFLYFCRKLLFLLC